MTEKKSPNPAEVHTIVFDFDGVFTDNGVYVTQDGGELVRCDRADGLAIRFLRWHQQKHKIDWNLLIISTEKNSVVSARAKKLGLPCLQGCPRKSAALGGFLAEKFPGLKTDPFRGVVFLGNDLNDLEIMEKVGFSVVPSDAHPMVQSRADLVLPQKGGHGFVRAFVEAFIGLENFSREEINEYLSLP